MIANDIISSILNRYKNACSNYPQPPSFIPNTKGDSFYLIKNRGEGLQPTQIRLSNHGTYLETWCDRNKACILFKSGIDLRLRRFSISKGFRPKALNDISFWKSSLHHITTHKSRTLPNHLLFLLA